MLTGLHRENLESRAATIPGTDSPIITISPRIEKDSRLTEEGENVLQFTTETGLRQTEELGGLLQEEAGSLRKALTNIRTRHREAETTPPTTRESLSLQEIAASREQEKKIDLDLKTRRTKA